jgi:hypothetical protein
VLGKGGGNGYLRQNIVVRRASRLVSSRLVSSRLVSSRLVSSRLVSSRLVSSRLVSSRSREATDGLARASKSCGVANVQHGALPHKGRGTERAVAYALSTPSFSH